MLQIIEPLHFLRPAWLAAVPLLVLLWWRLERTLLPRGGAWRAVCDPQLLAAQLVDSGASHWPLRLLLGGWLLAALALAGPTWSQRPQPLAQSLTTRVVVLDLSRSMTATDVKPSRLIRARYKAADALNQSRDGQVGLVVFAGAAFTVAPITRDAATLLNLLPVLEPALLPVQGSRVDLGLNAAGRLLTQAGVTQGSVLLITDGMNGSPEAALAAAQMLREQGFSLSVLAVGTAQGVPIQAADGSLLKDANGVIVIPQVDFAALQQLAETGGGRFAQLRGDGSDLAALAPPSPLLGGDSRALALSAEHWQDQGPWLVLALLPLATLAFRRGWLLTPLLAVLLLPAPVDAWEWQDLWLRRDQQASRALANGDAERAAELAADPWQRGTAAYRAERYQQALQAFAGRDDAVGRYNQGNSLAHLGRLRQALAAYDAALALDPTLDDARYNRDLVQRLLQQQQQRQQQQGNPQQQQQGNPQQQQTQTSPEPNGSGQTDPSASPRQDADRRPDERPDPATRPDSPPNPDRAENDPVRQPRPSADDQPLDDEQRQTLEQWLRRIPDDPGGLLRRKFQRQYQRARQRAQYRDAAQHARPW